MRLNVGVHILPAELIQNRRQGQIFSYLSSCGCNFRVPFRLINKPSENTKNRLSQGAFLQTHFPEFWSNCMKLTSGRYTRVPYRLGFIRRGIVSKIGQHLLHNVSNPWDPYLRRKILPLWRQLFSFEQQHNLYTDLFFKSQYFDPAGCQRALMAYNCKQ